MKGSFEQTFLRLLHRQKLVTDSKIKWSLDFLAPYSLAVSRDVLDRQTLNDVQFGTRAGALRSYMLVEDRRLGSDREV